MADGLNRYQPFPRHEDNVGEIISADHINSVEAEVETDERSLFVLRDQQFLDRCLFVLDNHPVANVMWVDQFEDTTKIDNSQFNGLVYSGDEQSIALDDTTPFNSATLLTNVYTPVTGAGLQNVILMTDDLQPAGTSITYYFSNDGGNNFIEITPNAADPVKLNTSVGNMILKAVFSRAIGQPSPVLYNWAVLYQDVTYVPYIPDEMVIGSTPVMQAMSHWDLVDVEPDQHHPQLHHHDGKDGSGTVSHHDLMDVGPDDHHPKIHRHSGLPGENDKVDLQTEVKGTLPERNLPLSLFTGLPGTTQIFRDATSGDRVTRVSSPDSDTYLFFNTGGQISRVLSIIGAEATDEYFDFGLDAAGNHVLLDVRKYVKDITEADVQSALAGGHVDTTTDSAWFIPYDPAKPAVKPDAPTNFEVWLTQDQPNFSWDIPTDTSVVGHVLYYAYGENAGPTTPWTEWTTVVPSPAAQYNMPISLPPGSYVFAISAVNGDGIYSDMTIFTRFIAIQQ